MPAKPRAVVIDRDPEFLAQVKRWFIASCLDFEVLPFSNGADALAFVRHSRVDLILTSYLVPQLDGLQLISAVRAFDRRVPIFMVSDVPMRAAALARDASGFFAKHRFGAALAAAVGRVLHTAAVPVA